MANLVNAYVIYNGTTGLYVGDDSPRPTVTINCERLNAFSPRAVWLKRILAPGDGTIILYEPTFDPTSDELLDTNTLQGFWIEQDGQDVMIDAVSLAAITDACMACCGEGTDLVAPFYDAGVTAFSPLTLNTFCIYRLDDGSAGAHDAFAADYVGTFVGKCVMRSNLSNTSHYTLQSYYTLAQFTALLKQGDTIYNGACSS